MAITTDAKATTACMRLSTTLDRVGTRNIVFSSVVVRVRVGRLLFPMDGLIKLAYCMSVQDGVGHI